MAFVDVGDDGYLGRGEPNLFDDKVGRQLVTVSGGPATALPLALPTTAAVARVTTSHQEWSGGSSDWIELSVVANLKLPVSVQVTGPSLAAPFDLGLSNDGGNSPTFRGQRGLNGATPKVGDVYTFAVAYSDGTFDTLTASVTGVVLSVPKAISPMGPTTDLAPTFTWSAPASPPAGPYTYQINVWPQNGMGGWWYGPMPGGQTSVAYNVDGTASSLAAGTTYQWNIEVVDANGNRGSSQATFSTP
jgi:hypothetical protein